jgi:type I restriction enzyme S subunit
MMLRASKSNILKDADEGNVFLGIKNMTATSLDLSEVKLIGHDDWSQWSR